MASVAQLVRAPGCGPGCRGFDPHRSPHKKRSSLPLTSAPLGSVAHLREAHPDLLPPATPRGASQSVHHLPEAQAAAGSAAGVLAVRVAQAMPQESSRV